MSFVIEIKAPELAKAIESLATAISGRKETEFQQITSQGIEQLANVVSFQQQQPAQTVVPTTQYQAPPIQQQAPLQQQPIQQQAPVQQPPVQQQQQTLPTTAPTYAMEQLAVAATQLMDSGRQPEVLNLLATFGVPSLMALPKEQYGAFATQLRGMGAKI